MKVDEDKVKVEEDMVAVEEREPWSTCMVGQRARGFLVTASPLLF